MSCCRHKELADKRGKFRLVSDQVVQQGPSFKQQSESWIDVETAKITVRTSEKGKDKTTTEHLDLPEDVSNGLLFVLLKNVDPSAETTVSFVVASTKPRVVKWNIVPGPEKTIKIGWMRLRARHYIVKTKIEGRAGAAIDRQAAAGDSCLAREERGADVRGIRRAARDGNSKQRRGRKGHASSSILLNHSISSFVNRIPAQSVQCARPKCPQTRSWRTTLAFRTISGRSTV